MLLGRAVRSPKALEPARVHLLLHLESIDGVLIEDVHSFLVSNVPVVVPLLSPIASNHGANTYVGGIIVVRGVVDAGHHGVGVLHSRPVVVVPAVAVEGTLVVLHAVSD